MPEAPQSDEPSPPPPRPLIEIVGLGLGPGGFRSVRIDGRPTDDAALHFDLHSAIRVRVEGRLYDESDAEIRFVNE